MPLLSIEALAVSFGGLRAVDALNLQVADGSVHGLIGPNGSGKTTLFNAVTGLCPVGGGEIRFAGRNIVGQAPHRITTAGIARSFQNQRLFEQMSVLENVLVGRHCRTRAGIAGTLLALPRAREERRRVRDEAHALLALFGERLLPRAGERAASLSYANRRRLEIARALATEPRLLMLDEPGAGMTPTEKRELAADIAAIRERGVTLLVIEHDMGLIGTVCDRVSVLDHGSLIAEGSFAEVRRHPAVIEAYLGRRHA